jgi:protoporphyrinogen oxidase
MTIAIIGGGITGLTIAYRLNAEGLDCRLFEKEKDLGGLASVFNFNDSSWALEKYYHHFFLCDKQLIGLINELGMGNKIISKATPMSFYINKELFAFGTPLDLLSFKPISFIDRIKLGLMIYYLMKKKSYADLEKISCEKWLIGSVGKNIYEKIWKPLLITKFGDSYRKISASWIWGRIHPRGNSRKGNNEELAYLEGGFNALIEALRCQVKNKIENDEVVEIRRKDNCFAVKTKNKQMEFSKVILTVPNPVISRICKSFDLNSSLEKIKYKGIVCPCLKIRKSLSRFYWTNVVDEDIDFGGLIEHTNLVDPKIYRGHIVYTLNYVDTDSRIYKQKDTEIIENTIMGIKKIFPGFDKSWVLEQTVHRDPYATPVYEINYTKIKPDMLTPVKGLLMANTSMIYPEDRNVNNSIVLANKAFEIIKGCKN